MQKINYQKKLDEVIEKIKQSGDIPALLIHSCCAPCSSYVLEYLSQYFKITIFYYNPNISPKEEYLKRVEEQKRLISQLPVKYPVSFVEGRYDEDEYYNAVKGLEHIPEGGERCFACYRLRLEETAKLAKEMGFEWFTTTLSISPYKNAQKLNEISAELSEIYDVKNLPSDFKKKEGYKRSIQLSREYNLYRQDYCGCVFSKLEHITTDDVPHLKGGEHLTNK
ncbi:MAG: epoxyqueuosine reductase QueH [Oscillospiraceae bacterium]